MYAVVKTGGKQYKVEKDTTFKVEKLENNVGDKITLPVVMYNDGSKVIADAKAVKNIVVEAQVVEQGKNKKIIVFKYKAKKNERKRQGHRQPFTTLKVLSIKTK